MELDFNGAAERGLRQYVGLVTQALGLPEHGTYLSLESPANAYVALDGRIATHPSRDVALLWDEHHGWSVAVETHGGADLLVLTYLSDEVVPEPTMVAGLVRAVFAGTFAGPGAVPAPREGAAPLQELARYADLEQPAGL